ncbi:ISL3 family transposase [Alkalicoccus luteus]|uniref:ISL3 family transposase n=1 Tax=Alkalicoccus luteus TaxID=1237094 RepID=A0A969PNU0_9BACI|nr:ISL3 family transposase [Alkalicoccus luteus]
MDDVAFRKGNDYGTLLADVDTHQPIALLPSRDAGTVAAWLTEHPEIQSVCRDRYKGFQKAIEEALPNAIQIVDRFHVIHNLKQLLDTALDTFVDATVLLEEAPSIEPAPPLSTEAHPSSLREKRMADQWERAQRCQALRAEGRSYKAIGRIMGIDYRTVKKDLGRDVPPPAQVPPAPDAIGWEQRMVELEGQRWSVRRIVEVLRLEGYRGSPSAVQKMVGLIRRHRREGRAPPVAAISRKEAKRLLWRWTMDGDPADRDRVHRLVTRFPPLAPFFVFIYLFREGVRQKDGLELERLMTQPEWKSVPLIHHFCQRLWRDRKALVAACEHDDSNGFMEGLINHLKSQKRIMQSRAKPDLLEKKVLYRMP